MSEFLLGRYFVNEAYAATIQQEEANDPRINRNGDIEYQCQYNIVKRDEQYIVTDTMFTCASYDTLEELMENMGLRQEDVFWT